MARMPNKNIIFRRSLNTLIFFSLFFWGSHSYCRFLFAPNSFADIYSALIAQEFHFKIRLWKPISRFPSPAQVLGPYINSDQNPSTYIRRSKPGNVTIISWIFFTPLKPVYIQNGIAHFLLLSNCLVLSMKTRIRNRLEKIWLFGGRKPRICRKQVFSPSFFYNSNISRLKKNVKHITPFFVLTAVFYKNFTKQAAKPLKTA
jgi:hypothetical protein